jgi:hypothetical protein
MMAVVCRVSATLIVVLFALTQWVQSEFLFGQLTPSLLTVKRFGFSPIFTDDRFDVGCLETVCVDLLWHALFIPTNSEIVCDLC